jgi:calcineurin-like phosphoesterase family protein
MLYFTSDTHFGHHNIIKYCKRPFENVDAMNQTIINNWNKTVTKDDIVFHLGDVAFKNDSLQIISQLNGTKWLIRGNHDKGYSDTKFRNNGFEKIFNKPYSFESYVKDKSVLINCMHAPRYFREGYINLCGHVHNEWENNYGYLNVGVDVWNFTPISLVDVISHYMKTY